MSTEQTEWKSIDLTLANLDFTGTKNASIESDGRQFISLTLTLRNGQIVRIRKNDYSVVLESPVIPMETKYIVKTKEGLSAAYDNEQRAREIAEKLDGEMTEVQVPKSRKQLEIKSESLKHEDLPF